jgi:hypothetical protein
VGILPGAEPGELARARLVIGLYDRWGYHPDLLDADAELLRMLKIIEIAGPPDASGPGGVEGGDDGG